MDKICTVCSRHYDAKRSDSLYCSGRCQKVASRAAARGSQGTGKSSRQVEPPLVDWTANRVTEAEVDEVRKAMAEALASVERVAPTGKNIELSPVALAELEIFRLPGQSLDSAAEQVIVESLTNKDFAELKRKARLWDARQEHQEHQEADSEALTLTVGEAQEADTPVLEVQVVVPGRVTGGWPIRGEVLVGDDDDGPILGKLADAD